MATKILVTGAGGFVGRALVDKMSHDADFNLVGVGRSPQPEMSIPYHQIDLTDQPMRTLLAGVETVIHLASRVHVMSEKATDPAAEYRRVNVDATVRLASQAAAAGCKRFVYLSSIKVNGEKTLERPFQSTDTPKPEDAYATSKLEAEAALFELSSRSEMDVVVLRPPLVYGPGVRANFLALMKAVSRGIPLPLKSIHNRRSLIYVENLADAIIATCKHPQSSPGVYLVADDEAVSTSALVNKIGVHLGKPAFLLPFPPKLLQVCGAFVGAGERVARLIENLEVDSSAFKRTYFWKPQIPIDLGLQKTSMWFRTQC